MKRYILCITGASGAPIALTLLKNLSGERYLIFSKEGERILEHECNLRAEDLLDERTKIYSNEDMWSPVASGSTLWDACIIIPCSMNTLSKVSQGICDNLITRVASIALKERRKLILVPRETPLSAIHLKNMYDLTLAGALILPAVMTFYSRPKQIQDMIDTLVARILDHLGERHALSSRWGE